MSGRRSVNIYDYPEHLNPFFEDDNHTKLRFWTNTKKKPRSNSFSFQSIKDFKQSLFSRPARKRSGTTSSSLSQLSCYHTHEINDETPNKNDEFSRSDEKRKSFIYPTLRKLGRSFSIRSKTKKRDTSLDRTSQNGENEAAYSRTPVVPHRQTMPVEAHTLTHRDRVSVSVTPLPRIRFHERLRNTESEKNDENKAASPTDDTNPFKDEVDDKILRTPSTSKPTTPPRKKKRAPPPPPMRQSSLTRKSLSAEFSLHSPEAEDNASNEATNHKDIIKTEIEITRTEIEITKTQTINSSSQENIPTTTTAAQENISSKSEENIPSTPPQLQISSKSEETISSKSDETDEIISSNSEENIRSSSEIDEPFQLTYNSELNISNSAISVSSETRLEQQQHQNAVEDSSDLLELVQKLQQEVEKLTDDTNNNVIATTNMTMTTSPIFESGKKPNFYGYDDDNYVEATTPSKIKAEINISLDAQDDDDDNDVVVSGAPLSPRLVRLKKDNEWIKH